MVSSLAVCYWRRGEQNPFIIRPNVSSPRLLQLGWMKLSSRTCPRISWSYCVDTPLCLSVSCFLMGPNMGPNPKDPNWKKQRQSSNRYFFTQNQLKSSLWRSLKKIQQHFARWIRGDTLELGILQAFGCFMIPRSEIHFCFATANSAIPKWQDVLFFLITTTSWKLEDFTMSWKIIWLNTSPSSCDHGTGRAPPMVTTACPVGHLLGEAMQKWGIQGKF